jgi:succinyl-diaminopimelate desuccinylase
VYATTVTGLVRAPRTDVYRALVDPRAVARWRVPDGMTAEVREWEPREGGRFRVSLTYLGDEAGKSGGRTDTYAGHFARLVPDEQVVEVMAFESADEALRTEMTMTTTLRDVEGGTEVQLLHDGIPDTVRPDDNEAGARMALAHLAAYVEEQGGWLTGPVPDRPSLDLTTDAVDLTIQLVDIESVSKNEQAIADAVEAALSACDHLVVSRHGNTVVARTELGRSERVVIAGHLDTVPVNDNLPARREGPLLHGLGTCDMKGGDAVILRLAATVPEPKRDVTYILYEAEEIDSEFNGLNLLGQSHPELMRADFAILMEPSNAEVEAGCQGTLRVEVRTTGERAHSARSWKGVNAIHAAGEILDRLNAYEPRKPIIDGLEYHEGLNAVFISGGVAGNVLPDECVVEVNHRFAPDRSEAEAATFVREFFEGYDVRLTDSAPGALPGLDLPAAKAFIEAVGGEVNPKFGWTDVARFTGLGIPAVNFGPGDPMLAHKQEEFVPVEHIERCERQLREWLT